jgi:hypothetical protein
MFSYQIPPIHLFSKNNNIFQIIIQFSLDVEAFGGHTMEEVETVQIKRGIRCVVLFEAGE